MDSYVKYIEQAGGRVVPLLYKHNIDETLAKMDHLNGVFYCGGDADDDEYFNMGKAIYEKAKKLNDQGIYYPVWGTCLGFKDLAMFEGGIEVLGKFRNHHTYDALKFLVNPLDTKLFKKLGTEAYTF